MRKIWILFLLAMLSVVTHAQINLVPNPSFEDTLTCPHFASQIDRAVGWYASKWSPDYFNECDWLNGNTSIPGNFRGYQYAQDGVAYAGIITYATNGSNFTESFTCQLLSPLVTGKKYVISFYASEGDFFYRLSANKLGALFSTVNYDTSNVPPMNNYCQFYSDSIITDTLNWILLQGSFTADSNYKYMTIGRFFDDANTDTIYHPPAFSYAYYYIDNISLIEDTITSVYENSIINQIIIYPNPAHDNIFIKNRLQQINKVEILDVLDKLYGRYYINKNQEDININLSAFQHGVYFVKIYFKENLFIINKLLIL